MTEPSVAHDEDRLLLHALADGELDAAAAMALERRLKEDPRLAVEFDRIIAAKDAVARLDRVEVLPDFRARIAALSLGQRAEPAGSQRWKRNLVTGWQAMAASVLVTAVVASGGTYLWTAQRVAISMADEVAGSHRRSLLAASPVDVASSNRHTVKPWLDAKLGISPPATDLATLGFPLVGGRVDVLGKEPVPTLVYRHNEHLITLFAAPGGERSTTPADLVAGGYNMVHWEAGGFAYWAVSDLEAGELQAFVASYRTN